MDSIDDIRRHEGHANFIVSIGISGPSENGGQNLFAATIVTREGGDASSSGAPAALVGDRSIGEGAARDQAALTGESWIGASSLRFLMR